MCFDLAPVYQQLASCPGSSQRWQRSRCSPRKSPPRTSEASLLSAPENGGYACQPTLTGFTLTGSTGVWSNNSRSITDASMKSSACNTSNRRNKFSNRVHARQCQAFSRCSASGVNRLDGIPSASARAIKWLINGPISSRARVMVATSTAPRSNDRTNLPETSGASNDTNSD